MSKYRDIWTSAHGSIPHDEDGRTYEIHHRNGVHSDDRLENLECLSIQEHFDCHVEMGDPFGAMFIAQRMGKPPSYLADLQRGQKRDPSIGAKISVTLRANLLSGKTIPSFTNRNHRPETKARYSEIRKNRRHSSKLSATDVLEMRRFFERKPEVPHGRGTYERKVAKILHEQFPSVTILAIINILTGKSWNAEKCPF